MAKSLVSRPKHRRRSHQTLEALETRALLSASPLRGPRALFAEVSIQGGPGASRHSVHAQGKGAALAVSATDNTHVLLRTTKAIKGKALRPVAYKIPGLEVVEAHRGPGRNSVILTTSPQANHDYTIRITAGASRGQRVRFAGENAATPTPVSVPAAAPVAPPTVASTPETTTVQAPPTTAPAAPPKVPTIVDPVAPATSDAPRVVSAISTDNHTVVVQFSEKMSDSVLNASNYSIVQSNVNSEAGGLRILHAPVFVTRNNVADRSSVILTTASQNELTYTVNVANVLDSTGTPIQPRTTLAGVIFDPTSANFAGTPPTGSTLEDSDGDGLSDNEEQRGYLVQVNLANGTVVRRGVTSDPYKADTDNDGLDDYTEAQIQSDPRSPDTDTDTLTDYQEWNEILSDPLSQDTDGDGLDDGSEFNGFKTSPNFADTDGDQMTDLDEILSSRNPRVADLPQLAISVGAINLGLDVRFSASSSSGTRVLETKSVSSSIQESSSHEHSYQAEVSAGFNVDGHVGTEVDGGKAKFVWGVDVGVNSQWTNTTNDTDRTEAAAAYDKSLSTDKEATTDETVQRDVVGAQFQTTVNLQNFDRLAFRVKNLQVTAFISDPQDPSILTPIATLLPEAEPDDGYTLGPLYPERGPIIVSSTTIFPSLVEDLLKNPRGLVFKISNYDIIDEAGRNFGFSSQQVAERTGAVVIDYGGAGSNSEKNPEIPESYRVATTTGRVAADTNDDGTIDDSDHPVVYDAQGQAVGITLRDALGAVGLKHYTAVLDAAGKPKSYTDEDGVATSTLTSQQLGSSYVTVTKEGVTRVYSVRNIAEDGTAQKYWRLLDGRSLIIPDVDLDSMIIKPDANFALSLVQDLDNDLIPANIEYRMGTSDRLRDTDGDGLDDRFEAYVGWDVDLGAQGRRHVYSSPTQVDSDRDGLSDYQEAPRQLLDFAGKPFVVSQDGNQYISGNLIELLDTDGDMKVDSAAFEWYINPFGLFVKTVSYDPNAATVPLLGSARKGVAVVGYGNTAYPAETLITDPLNRDTDGDGLADKAEVDGVSVTLRGASGPVLIKTDPTLADTDGDTAPDGLEVRFGGNPTNPADRDDFADDDGDGLLNIVEKDGWEITIYPRSYSPYQKGQPIHLWVKTDPENDDSDGDMIKDGEEYALGTVPGYYVDFLYLNGSKPVSGSTSDPYSDGTNNPSGSRNNYNAARKVAVNDTSFTTDDGYFAVGSAIASPLDSDLDGLTDFQEVRGFTLRDLGIITLDPTDADTDHDNRLDGDEAELVFDPKKVWIVSPSDGEPFRVYSNPLIADEDLDGVVDGQEWAGGLNFDPTNSANLQRSDPNQADTDGDGRDDNVEYHAGTKVNVKDHHITVAFQMIHLVADGDAGPENHGDFEIGLAVRPPVPTSVSFDGLDPARRYAFHDGYGNSNNRIPITTGQDFYFAEWLGHGAYTSGEAYSFGMTETDRFDIEGYIDEHDEPAVQEVQLGGFRGTDMKDDKGTARSSILSWDDVKDKSMHRYTFDFDSSGGQSNVDVNSSYIKGTIVLYVFID